VSNAQWQAQIAAAQAYEDLFVPALFSHWAEAIAAAADVTAGKRVLDVACGTGILARRLASLTGSSQSIVGLDLTPGMLEVARRVAPAIHWQQGSAEDLPFTDGSFDAVVSQFGLMFFSDRVQALRELLRVLVPGGRLAIAVWDSIDNIPAFADELALMQRIAGRDAADALRSPFVLGASGELEQLARDADIREASVATHRALARFPSIRSLVEADLRGWLPMVGVVLDENTIQRVLAEAEIALRNYAGTRGELVFEISAHVLSGARSKIPRPTST
jgi:SAM-dependent methyltransferase